MDTVAASYHYKLSPIRLSLMNLRETIKTGHIFVDLFLTVHFVIMQCSAQANCVCFF